MTDRIESLKVSEYLAKYKKVRAPYDGIMCCQCGVSVTKGTPVWGYKNKAFDSRWVNLCDNCYNEIMKGETMEKTEAKTKEIMKFDFNGNQVPVIIDDDGNPWWVAKEVCGILGYKNVSDTIVKHCKHAKKMTIAKRDGHRGGARFVLIIPEGDLYRLIAKSRLPEAQRFEEWMMDEVMPTIRKTGGYIHTTPEMTDMEILAKGFLIATEKIKERDKKIAEIEVDLVETKKVSHARKETIKVLHPKATKYDKLMSTDTLISISEGAKLYSSAWSAAIGPKKFAAGMRDMKIFYKKFDTNLPYQKYLDAGWFCVRETERGFRQTMITTEGMNKIVEIHPARFMAAWGSKAA